MGEGWRGTLAATTTVLRQTFAGRSTAFCWAELVVSAHEEEDNCGDIPHTVRLVVRVLAVTSRGASLFDTEGAGAVAPQGLLPCAFSSTLLTVSRAYFRL